MALLDRVIFLPSAGGLVDFAVASAVIGYQTPASAGAINGALYEYAAETRDGSGNVTAWEVGNGPYTVSTTTLARTNIRFSSNANAKVNFASAPNVMITGLTLGDNPTLTASAPVLDLAQTWNNVAVVFTGLKFNFTNTTSAAGTSLMNLQIGGKNVFTLTKDPALYVYNTSDSNNPPTDYERGTFDWVTTANSLTIGTQKGGAGTARDLILTAASNTIFLSSGCNFRMQGAGSWAYFVGTAVNGGGIFLNGSNFFGSITTNDNIIPDLWSLGKATTLGSNSPTAALSWNFPASGAGNVIVGTAAIATNATDGFLYISTCAGTPTGTPTTFTGRVPMVYDTTNNKFYIYNGSWKGGTVPGTFS
jgi:hypothetical protein